MAININIQVASLMPIGGWGVHMVDIVYFVFIGEIVGIKYNRVVNALVPSFLGKPEL